VLRALELVPLVLVMLCQSTRSVQIAVSAHGSARHACRTFATGCSVPQAVAPLPTPPVCSVLPGVIKGMMTKYASPTQAITNAQRALKAAGWQCTCLENQANNSMAAGHNRQYEQPQSPEEKARQGHTTQVCVLRNNTWLNGSPMELIAP
jgi:hypothetical protein